MAEVESERCSSSTTKSDDEGGQEEDLDLHLLESDSSESEDRKKQVKERKQKKREHIGDMIDKPLSELAQQRVKRYENRGAGNFCTGFDVHSKKNKERCTSRAKRFGIKPTITAPKDRSDISLGVLPPGSTIGGHNVRSAALFLSGVDEMSTQDVFNYFKGYDPSSVEWINDTSCNVVWLDPHSAARALYNMSQPRHQHIIPQHIPTPPPPPPPPQVCPPPQPVRGEEHEPEPMEQEEEDDDDEDVLDLVSDRETGEQERQRRSPNHSPNASPPPPPSSSNSSLHPSQPSQGRSPGAVDNSTAEDDMDMGPVRLGHEEASWTGVPCPSANQDLIIRYATTADKKEYVQGHRSQYYIKHGNPNFGGMKGLISRSLKKRIKDGKFVPAHRKRRLDEDEYEASNTEDYARKRHNHGGTDLVSSSSEWTNQRREEERGSDEGGFDVDRYQQMLMGKPAMEPRRKMRMYADDEEEEQRSNIREQTAATPAPQIVDARQLLTKSQAPATSRLGYHVVSDEEDSDGSETSSAGFTSGNIPNLKVMVPNDVDSWDEGDDEDDDYLRGGGKGKLIDLRNRLDSRQRNNSQYLDRLPSLSVYVEQDNF